MTKQRAVILAAAAILGCNSNSTGPQQGTSKSCTVTLSGAVSGTYDCRPATTSYGTATDATGFTFGVRASGSQPAIGLSVVWIGTPTDTIYRNPDGTYTYTNTNGGAQADISVTTSNGQTWLATVGEGPPAAGTYILNFATVTANNVTASGALYDAEGTVTATLPAVASSGATGTIILSATF